MQHIDTGKKTVPICSDPQDCCLSRHSGWLCRCGDWHPYPRPAVVQALAEATVPFTNLDAFLDHYSEPEA